MFKLTGPVSNLFNGFNPYTMAFLQQDGENWDEFHKMSFGNIQNALNDDLERHGYVARLRPGLQVRIWDEDAETWGRRRNPEPDVLITDKHPSPDLSDRSSPSNAPQGAIVFKAEEAAGLSAEKFYWALAIFDVQAKDKENPPVAWIELLSPSNKPHHLTDWQDWRDKLEHLSNGGPVGRKSHFTTESKISVSNFVDELVVI